MERDIDPNSIRRNIVVPPAQVPSPSDRRLDNHVSKTIKQPNDSSYKAEYCCRISDVDHPVNRGVPPSYHATDSTVGSVSEQLQRYRHIVRPESGTLVNEVRYWSFSSSFT